MYELRPVYPNELYHHGIKNQQWGVQNGPPYPLDRATHRAVVKQQKAERKENKREYRGQRENLYKSAYSLHIANSTQKGASKAAAKAAFKAGKSKAHAEKALHKEAKAKDAAKLQEFWRKQYLTDLKAYTNAAQKAGKKVRYDDSDKSIRKAAGRAMNRNTVTSFGLAGQLLFGLPAGVVGYSIDNAISAGRLSKGAKAYEQSKGFNRYANAEKLEAKNMKRARH